MKTVLLADICEVISRGISPKYTESDDGIIILNQKCIRNHTLSFEQARVHDNLSKPIQPEKLIRNGDILINSTGQGTLGRTTLVEGLTRNVTVDSHITIVRPNNNVIYPQYLSYLVEMRENELVALATGTSGQTELPRVLLQNFKVIFEESLDKQRRIVSILDRSFEKINKATELADKVQFDVRRLYGATLEKLFMERGLDVAATDVILSDVCDIQSKLIDPRKSDYSDLLHVGGANIESETGRLINLKTAHEESLISGKFLFDENTVLYSKIRPYLMKVARPDFSGLCSADIYPLIPKRNKLSRDFLFYLLLSPSFTEYAIAGSGRAGMPKVNRLHLFKYSFTLPSLLEQEQIVRVLDKVARDTQNLHNLYQQKINVLFELKRSLLNTTLKGDL